MFDLVIKGGLIVDGSGGPPFKADVGVRGGSIGRIGSISAAGTDSVIDAEGLIVSPGFIDMHSHSDFTLLINPKAESKVRQGVTLEVIGNCGYSAAPLSEESREEVIRSSHLIQMAGLELDWSTMGEYLDRLERQGVALNVTPLVGHGTLRAAVMGYEDRAPTGEELEKMKELTASSMKDGAFGLSTGLIYAPGCYADTKEIIELCRVVQEYGGIYATHMRNEGDRLIEAVGEAIGIGREANIPVEISHHKAHDRRNWGKVNESLKLIERARDGGTDVSCDVYPYTASSTSLTAYLPTWVREGGMEELLARIVDPQEREKIRQEISARIEEIKGDLFISSVKSEGNKEFEGKNLSEISEKMGLDAVSAVFELLSQEEGSVGVIHFGMSEEDVRKVIAHRNSVIGSDSSARARYGVLSTGKPHPRAYGTFPRVLGKYVREEGLLTLEQAIRKMTGMPAERLGLRRKGYLREGYDADLAVFDRSGVGDRATFQSPHQYPEGIRCVVVHGKAVVSEGEHLNVLPGKVLRHGIGTR